MPAIFPFTWGLFVGGGAWGMACSIAVRGFLLKLKLPRGTSPKFDFCELLASGVRRAVPGSGLGTRSGLRLWLGASLVDPQPT